MFSISSVSKKLLEKLRRKPYRDAYVSEHVRRGISAQIRAMRDQRGWPQGKLSGLMNKPQSVVSRLEDPNYGKVTVQTLLEVAATFDVALSIRFVSYPTFLSQTRDLTGSALRVDSFDTTRTFNHGTVQQVEASLFLTDRGSVPNRQITSTQSITLHASDLISTLTRPVAADRGLIYIQSNAKVMARA